MSSYMHLYIQSAYYQTHDFLELTGRKKVTNKSKYVKITPQTIVSDFLYGLEPELKIRI